MVGCRSSRLNQNKPFPGPVLTLMSSSAEFYSFSLSGRLRAVGLNALTHITNIYIKLYITNCRQYCFGLLGLLSAVPMSGMKVGH